MLSGTCNVGLRNSEAYTKDYLMPVSRISHLAHTKSTIEDSDNRRNSDEAFSFAALYAIC